MAYETTDAYAALTEPGADQASAEGAAGPSPSHPAPSGPVCRSCGTANAVGADRCAGPTCRRMLPGNAIALKTGLTSSAMAGELAASRRDFYEQALADDGGAEESTVRRRALLDYRARLHTHLTQLSDAIEQHGLFDRRGRLRAIWLQRLEGLVDRARAIDQTLGLSRRSRPVESAADIVAEYRQRDGEQR